ncbi:MAG: P-loop NTPase [Bacteroidales bacterium]|jgi:MinD superfamily P-loop ATPase|nr:P-loop NTPase [Bacteroidales bacterium]OQC03625.1 MAG: ferredoxin [Bacteroidetes bacterium ADurb.Bin090]MBP8981415.1 P-loop NTPase [Bacteroidales bacterium]NLV39302.1 P-loop NTPase [Bacteroidales bacterium]HNZ80352.1 P-loop NTPase [Bacteroidales bacterium]
MELAVVSGKGGTGKSSITAALAVMKQKLLLADCDVDAANLYLLFQPEKTLEQVYVSGHTAIIDKDSCTNCGLCMDYCRFDAIHLTEEEVQISGISCEGCFLCSRICPEQAIRMEPEDRSRLYAGNFRYGKMVYGRLFPGEENSGRLVNLVRQQARDIARKNELDLILLDGPPGIGCPVISTITGVDKVLIVTEPSVSGLHDLQRIHELCRHFGLSQTVVINKHDLNPDMCTEIERYCREQGLKLQAKIPFDPQMVEAMVKGQSILEYAPESPAALCIKNHLEELL